MTALFEYLHTIQSVWVDNLEYQVKEGWLWLDPVLTLVRDYFFETTVVVTVILLYIIIFSVISLYNRQPQNKIITRLISLTKKHFTVAQKKVIPITLFIAVR